MRDQVLQGLAQVTLKTFCEGTLGAAGHAKALLDDHPEIEKYIGMDKDPSAFEIAKEVLSDYQEKVMFNKNDFKDLDQAIAQAGLDKVDGFLFDLGVSSMQFDQGERGFSFRYDAPLDMRMDSQQEYTAEDAVNTLSESDLGEVLRDYGEVPFWKRAAQAIVEARPLKTTGELADLTAGLMKGRGKIHPATLVFQALRIHVNRELESLEVGLKKALDHLNPNGVIGVISFHSLEDRIVKNIFKEAASPLRSDRGKKIGEPPFELMVKKPLVPTSDEVRANPRARSAKLRWIRRR